ncbi:MAG: hypothetical protein QM767_25775 [Anaeromyxobacter sp.]
MNTEQPYRKHLAEQLCRILEETAFMLVEDPEAPLPEPSPAIQASLTFSGRANGTCWLIVSEADARQLATEMLGMDGLDVASGNASDNAAGELLNILTAWMLDSWWGENIEHNLGIPETRRLPMTQTPVWQASNDSRVVVSTDSGCVFLSCVTLEN